MSDFFQGLKDGTFHHMAAGGKTPDGKPLVQLLWVFQDNQFVITVPAHAARQIALGLVEAADEADNALPGEAGALHYGNPD